MQTLEDFDRRMEEIGVQEMTPSLFMRERRRLEQRFTETYRIVPAMINPLIKSGEIHDGDLLQEWVELMEFEPYVFPSGSRRRPPDVSPEENSQQGREGGLFSFRNVAILSLKRLYWALWLGMRRRCFGRRSYSSKITAPVS